MFGSSVCPSQFNSLQKARTEDGEHLCDRCTGFRSREEEEGQEHPVRVFNMGVCVGLGGVSRCRAVPKVKGGSEGWGALSPH